MPELSRPPDFGTEWRGYATVTARHLRRTLVVAARLLAAVVTGLLLARSFMPSSPGWLVLTAFVPLLRALVGVTWRSAALLGWVSGVAACAAGFSWLLPAVIRFQDLSVNAGALAFAGFVAYHAMQVALFAAGVALIQRGAALSTLVRMEVSSGWAIASWWVALEWLFPQVLPWHLGDCFAPSPALRQSVDLFGVYGLSYFAMVVNAWLCNFFARDMSWRRRLRVGGFAAALVAVTVLYGISTLYNISDRRERKLTVALVQGGVGAATEIERSNERAWQVYAALSRDDAATRGNADLLLWPETALRVYLAQDEEYRSRVEALVARLQRPLLVGSLRQEADGERNSAFLFTPRPVPAQAWMAQPEITSPQVYEKQQLVPFGEYVPLRQWWSGAHSWRTTGQFVRGDARASLWLDAQLALAPSICFEALMPGIFGRHMVEGAHVLVNLSNDGWFDDPLEAEQHLNVARLRAVENRRWLVRASDSGISAVIDPTGEIVASLPLHGRGVLRSVIGARDDLTIYAFVGNAVLAFAVIDLVWFALRIRAESYYARKDRAQRAHQQRLECEPPLPPATPRPRLVQLPPGEDET